MSTDSMLCLKDFESHAEKVMDKRTWEFICQGAEREQTLKENEECYRRYTLIPRMLRNAAERDLSVTVLGEKWSFPVGLAPTAHQKMAHPDGEVAAVRAAAKMGTLYTLSSISNTPLEEVSRCAPSAPKWMQVYVLKNRKATEDMVRRAEKHGFKALVLTVDTPIMGLRLRMKRMGLTLPSHLSVPNLDKGDQNTEDVRDIVDAYHLCDTLTWDDVKWLQSISKLPLILKGIMTVEDALMASEHGVAGVWVSNHGGRQLDGINTSMDVLEDICAALAGTSCEVYADGGVRWGTDVLKALALGARAVFVGRPVLWGLVHNGEEGVTKILEILKSELDRAMHLMGCKSISDIGPHLVRKQQYSRI